MMKRFLKLLFIVVPLLGVVALVALYFSLNSVVKAGVEAIGSAATKTVVDVGRVRLSPLSGDGRIVGLTVGNPDGFKTAHAFDLGQVHIAMDPRSLRTDTIIVHEILIDSPEITYERGLTTSNIAVIRKNVEEFARLGSDAEPAAERGVKEEPVASKKRIRVGRFALVNAKVNVSSPLLMGKAVTLDIPDIELTDIGQDKETVSVADVLNLVLGTVTRTVIGVATDAAGLAGQGEAVHDALKDLGDGARDTGHELKKQAEGVVEGLKGILGSD